MKKSWLFAASVAASLGLAAGSSAADTAVSIGMSGWTGFAPLTLAKEAGLFKKHGLDVDIKKIPQKDRHLAIASGDGRPKVIRHLNWQADLPTGTRLQLRSRSGNQLQTTYTFYDRKGEAVTEEKWLSSPKVLRGKIDSTLVTGEDWDSWSNE